MAASTNALEDALQRLKDHADWAAKDAASAAAACWKNLAIASRTWQRRVLQPRSVRGQAALAGPPEPAAAPDSLEDFPKKVNLPTHVLKLVFF